MALKFTLPPRFVQPISEYVTTNAEGDSKEVKRRVEFRLEKNVLHEITTFQSSVTWYSGQDYANFAELWRLEKGQVMRTLKRSMQYPLLLSTGKKQQMIPSMEEFEMMRPERPVCRKNLIRSILMHQAQCRVRGYVDPDGYSYLSRALSKADKKQAWQSAAVNAYEVESYGQEETLQQSSLLDLFAEYYMESIYPYLASPLILMSKLLLCECD
jgi:hypothetical protein